MNEGIVSASGERAAIGGYLPQFDELAWFVYLNLINNNLEWIRIADPNAEKLDDIQYSTYSEIHAYQVKWTTAEAKISFANFTELVPLIVSSWRSLKTGNPSKKIIPHLITNKPISSHDNVKDGDIRIGSFEDFISDVWLKLKSHQSIDDKWKPIIEQIRSITRLSETEFNEFIQCFDFQAGYMQKKFSVSNIRHSKEEEDLQQLSRFIIEKVASPTRVVEFKRHEIIKELEWSDRFKTIFNHDLIIDRKRYQPIQSTIDVLNSKLTEYYNGYLFLLGGPGSGKSTLLTQWSKGLKARTIRYYAFDFVNPSSHLNFYERGNATYLFFDLVFQLKEAGIYKSEILPYRDLLFLKEVFREQLNAIGEDYRNGGQQTIIIIDGLDHVPREYKSTTNSFLRELPLSSSLPKGVFIILGSQSYELEDIQQEIKAEFLAGSRTIQMEPLKKEEVYRYLDSFDTNVILNGSQKLLIFEKSQGHPLYLSYLIEKINGAESIDGAIESFDIIEGDIVNYYKKIWAPIQREELLVNLLGLISRINGSINLDFIQEWEVDRGVLKLFSENAKVLFNKTEHTITFFHNSYKQFLLYHSSLNYLTGEFDPVTNLKYHVQLADYYKNSAVENIWKRNYHLYQAKLFTKFVSEVTPDSFTSQFINFRPVESIKQDAKLGIEIARQTKDAICLIRYLFSLAEIEKRLFYIDPASFTEELLMLNEFDLARNYLRSGNILHCGGSNAFKAARLFIDYGHRSEGEILFNLAYPELITESGIIIDDSHSYEEIKETIEEWISTSPHFESIEKIFSIIKNISFSAKAKENRLQEKEDDLLQVLLTRLGYSLVDQNKWMEFNQTIERFDHTTSNKKNALFYLLQYAIEHCLDIQDSGRANEYLSLLTFHFNKKDTKQIGKIYIADLIHKVTGNVDETFNWIEDVEQPSNVGKDQLGYADSLESFRPLIKLNKLLNLCQKGVSITSAIPSVDIGKDEELLVEFERMLCLTTQILSDGILHNQLFENIIKRVSPIVRFYYKDVSQRNTYWYRLTQPKGQYFDFLIYAVSLLGARNLEILGEYLFSEFLENQRYWSPNIQRKILKSLLSYGHNPEKVKIQLKNLEESMLLGHDVDGRINECLAQSKLYFILDEPEEGKRWLKKAIQETIGVGYSKDYQFSTWIGWLRKINQKDPSNASKRIKWFLSQLNHIKETTEGRAYWNASEELLEATYEHNLCAGLEQTIWQLEHYLIDFKDSITLFIKYFVKQIGLEEEFKCIIQIYNGLYLLLMESANSFLLKQILAKGYEILEGKLLVEYVPSIISAINIRAFEETRYYLLSGIKDFFLSKGIRIEDYYSDFKIPTTNERDSFSESSNTLILKTNSQGINENEVLERVSNFEEFKRIVQEEDQTNSFFNWSKVLQKITPNLSSNQIEEIARLARVGRGESAFYAKLSEAASELGNKELALSLANRSIELSSESGWVKFYDGGTRINAFRALQKVNPKLSTEKAFEVFAQDIISTNYPSSYIEHLEDIMPLLTENFNEEDLWPEIFDYLQRLMSNSTPIEILPAISSINQPILDTLVDFIKYLTKSPVTIIKEQSTLLLATLIDQNIGSAFTQLLKENEDDYLAMDLIMILFELKSSMIHELRSKIQAFSVSTDYQLRENSKQILNAIGEEVFAPKNIKLPIIYTMHIIESKKPEFNKEIDPYFPSVDINEPSLNYS